MRVSRFLPAAAVLAIALAAPAAAAPPEIEKGTIVVDEPQLNFVCPDGREVLATYTIDRTVFTYLDAAGDPLREVRQIRWSGRLWSDDLSRSVPYFGRIRRAFDSTTSQLTITGKRVEAELPGPDPRVSGRLHVDFDDGIEVERGRGYADFDAAVCAHLYA
jgi:hypothetical protein